MAEFKGEQFDAPEHVNQRRLNRLGIIARQAAALEKAGDEAGAGEVMMEFMAAVEDLVVMCLRPEDVERFDRICDERGASNEELQAFIVQQVAEVGQRPTQRSSDSSDGPKITQLNSADDSSSTVVSRLEDQGRPDLALLVTQSQLARTA